MKTSYDIMLNLNRAITRKAFEAEYRRIRWFVRDLKKEVGLSDKADETAQ